MNGIHDMGGMHGFGPLPFEEEEPLFHQPWEARVLATNLALSPHVGSNVDRFRFLIESMPPADYLNASYYERWLASLLAACTENGILTAEELDAINRGEAPEVSPAGVSALPAAAIRNIVTGGKPEVRDYSGNARFEPGQKVTAKNMNPAGHTRLARYVRGRRGEVISDNGKHLLPDDHARQPGTAAEPDITMERLYTVKFAATELWGQDANPRDSVCIDLWESYLERA
jgi:nitrile hydratase beta subunit